MRHPQMPRFGLLVAGVLFAASCTSDPISTGSTETTVPTSVTTVDAVSTTTVPPSNPPGDSAPATTAVLSDQIEILDDAGLVSADDGWNKLGDLFFVWGVEPDDVLNVRSGPGINNPIVATLGPGSGDLSVYDAIEIVGNSNWVPVELADEGRGGWVSNQFLRPEPPAGGAIVQGSAPPELLLLMDETLAALSDAESLGALVGSEGLTLSPSAFVGPDVLTLTQAQIVDESDVDRTWGVTAGKGDDIVATLDQYLEGLNGRTAITSTAEIGYDVTLGGGNSINNLAEVFPEANVVEYYHPGTSFYGGLDWTALRFVFETNGERLVLRALISDQWEI